MHLYKLAKDEGSGRNGCPTVYATDTRDLVIQGDQADADTMASLENPLTGENAVVIKREVVEAALRKLLERDGDAS